MRKQIVPVAVVHHTGMTTAKDLVFYMEKHHTKLKKAAKASSIQEITEAMINGEISLLLYTLPDCPVLADEKVDGMVKLLENATNSDLVMKPAAQCPMAFNSALSLKMADDHRIIAEIDCVLSATYPTEDTTFVMKWKRAMKCRYHPTAMTSSRHVSSGEPTLTRLRSLLVRRMHPVYLS